MKKVQCVLLVAKLSKKEGRKCVSMESGEAYVVMDGLQLMVSCFVKIWGILNQEQVSHCMVWSLEIGYAIFMLCRGQIISMDATIFICQMCY